MTSTDKFPLTTSKFPLILLAAGFLFLVIVIPIFYLKSRNEALAYHFNGRIDSVSYDNKGIPTIVIHKVKYNLLANFWNFEHELQVGDSLIKEKNSLEVKIFKKNGAVIIER